MRALLLAAGMGTRLRPLTELLPKCLIPIQGYPLIEYWLAALIKAGITDITINIHYLHELVIKYIEASSYKKFITLCYEETLLGTAGTVRIQGMSDCNSPVMLIHADNLCSFSMKAFMAAFEDRQSASDLTMMTFKTDKPSSCGIVECDSDGLVTNFHEKVDSQPGNLANGALYIFDNKVMEFIDNLGCNPLDFSTQVLPGFIGRINTWHNSVYHRDIGTVESFLLAQAEYTSFNYSVSSNSFWQGFWIDHEHENLLIFGQLLSEGLQSKLWDVDLKGFSNSKNKSTCKDHTVLLQREYDYASLSEFRSQNRNHPKTLLLGLVSKDFDEEMLHHLGFVNIIIICRY